LLSFAAGIEVIAYWNSNWFFCCRWRLSKEAPTILTKNSWYEI